MRTLAQTTIGALIRRTSITLLAGGILAPLAQAQLPKHRICVSVFRYGGRASGWVAPTDLILAAITPPVRLIVTHLARANAVFAQANVEWVWDQTVTEDLADVFGRRNGDIQWTSGVPTDQDDRRPVPSQGGGTGSPDIDRIFKDTENSQCYPVVFVNGGLGAAGVTYGEEVDFRTVGGNPPVLQLAKIGIGRVTLIDVTSFPRQEDATTFQGESLVSTLAHEFGHAVCLEPLEQGWGDQSGHPVPFAPEAAGLTVIPPFADAGKFLHFFTMWFTGVERLGTELFSTRESQRASICAGIVRSYRSPSFAVEPNGPSGLPPNKILAAPADVGDPFTPPIDIGIDLLNAKLDAVSYGLPFKDGRFPFKFTVNKIPLEYAAPLGPAAKNKLLVLGMDQFGLKIGDQISALEQSPPAFIDPPPGVGVLNPTTNAFQPKSSRVYFSVAPGSPAGLDLATIYTHTAVAAANGGVVLIPGVYADRTQLLLQPRRRHSIVLH